MRIHGIDRLTKEELESALANGARFVVFEYCVSLVIATLRRSTDVYLLQAGELGLVRGLRFTLVSCLFGWWGIPWGIVLTPLTLYTNLAGGRDVTAAVREWMQTGGS
jgi:hypothetical protein